MIKTRINPRLKIRTANIPLTRTKIGIPHHTPPIGTRADLTKIVIATIARKRRISIVTTEKKVSS